MNRFEDLNIDIVGYKVSRVGINSLKITKPKESPLFIVGFRYQNKFAFADLYFTPSAN